MKFMKKLMILLTALFCSSGVVSVSAQEIGVAWVGKAGMANSVTEGFDKAIKILAPEIKVEYRKELETMDDLAKVVAEWEKSKAGMVILRSNGAEWLAANPPSIPTFIGGCNNPKQLGAVKNLESPEGNITGVTYFLPYNTQFEIFRAILPDLKSVLLLVEAGHPSTPIDQEGTSAVCKKLGLVYQDKVVSTKEEALAAVKEAGEKVSAIILGTQALIIDNAVDIIKAAGQTPTLSYTNKTVKSGALGGFAADDVKLGSMLADSLVEVLVKGKQIKNVPVKMDPDPKFFVNAKTAEKLGVEIPFDILQAATVIE